MAAKPERENLMRLSPDSDPDPQPADPRPPHETERQEEQEQEEEAPRESLLSLERLDRASPDLWPEQRTSITDAKSQDVPGVSEFAPLEPAQSPPPWSRGLTQDDITYMHQLGALGTSGLITEVKKLHDLAYQLGVEEAKEMTRGKYLNIFTSRRPR